MSFNSFLIEYKTALLFYGIVILLIYINRSKFEIQGKIFALYRTKFGLKTIPKFALKYERIIKPLAKIGVVAGFIGMIGIFLFLIYGFINLFINPDSLPIITPVLPGFKIPGSPIKFPLFYTLTALFVVVVIHEFSHGIVAAAYKLKIKSTGVFFVGPLIGAFVEPDEKQVKKKSHLIQNSIFAAGPFSNLLTGLIIFILLTFIIAPIHASLLYNNIGVGFYDVQNDTPAYMAKLNPNMTITKVDNIDVKNINDFTNYLNNVTPNQTLNIQTDSLDKISLTTTTHPNDSNKGYIGILGVHTKTELKNDTILYNIISKISNIFQTFLVWVFILSIGLGLGNLIPIGPVDGGRMLQLVMHSITGNKKKGDKIWAKFSTIVLMIVLILLFVPILKATFGLLF